MFAPTDSIDSILNNTRLDARLLRIAEKVQQQEVTLIEKEDLSTILFSKSDVISDPVKRRLRQIYLEKAERLGNAYHGKVKMTFMTEDGKLMMVHTTIWSADQQYITLKGGIHIPTISIVEVEFS